MSQNTQGCTSLNFEMGLENEYFALKNSFKSSRRMEKIERIAVYWNLNWNGEGLIRKGGGGWPTKMNEYRILQLY